MKINFFAERKKENRVSRENGFFTNPVKRHVIQTRAIFCLVLLFQKHQPISRKTTPIDAQQDAFIFSVFFWDMFVFWLY